MNNAVRTAAVVSTLASILLGGTLSAIADNPNTNRVKRKDDGYRGIWFTLGQYSDTPDAKRFWPYGDKYSGGLGTYTAKHVPIAIYAPEARKTFFCYGGAREGKRYLYNMISYYDHEQGVVPRPVIVHDKEGVNDPHDNPSMTIDEKGHIWVYVAGRGRVRPGFTYRSVRPYDIDEFDLIYEGEVCYPQPYWIPGEGILELFTKYTGVRELYWNTLQEDGTRGKDQKLAGMGGQYQTTCQDGRRVATAFNMHPKGNVDQRTNLYYLETTDMGRAWRTVDGKVIAPPLVDPANPALVRDYRSENRLCYLNSVTFDRKGNPVILIVTSSDHRPGPQGDPRTWEIAHWTGHEWVFHEVTNSTHNYDTGPLWVEKDGTWRIIGPTERGPQRWGGGGEIAAWESSDKGRTWRKVRDVTESSPRNNSYVRPVVNGRDDFYALWADGHADKFSISRLYFCNRQADQVWTLPYDMEGEFAKPQRVP